MSNLNHRDLFQQGCRSHPTHRTLSEGPQGYDHHHNNPNAELFKFKMKQNLTLFGIID